MSKSTIISKEFNITVINPYTTQDIPSITIDSLHTVLTLFNEYFPHIKKEEIKIIFDPLQNSPICYSQLKTIYLTCECQNADQVVYQFAHELCHFCINNPNNIETNLSWFEESICELASYFFLDEVSKTWQKNKLNYIATHDKSPYLLQFHKYKVNDMTKAKHFDISSLITTNPIINELYQNAYNRELNAHVAISLLPIFNSYPGLWKTLVNFKDIHENSLKDFLLSWYSLSPSYLNRGLLEILKVFGLTRNDIRIHQQRH